MNTDDQHDFLHPRRGPAPLTPSDLAEQLAADHPQLSIQPDAPLVGGMGAVYRATLTTSACPRLVAIKVLHWLLMDDPAFTARFQREQALLSQFDHPNIVKLHLTGHTTEGLPFLVMDWIEGRSLTEFTQPGSTTDRQRLLRIADDLCAATHYAHEIEYKDAQGVQHKGILHRDLKPQNIIVTAAGRAVVLDFGIARPLTPGHTLTHPGDAPGTHGYIAPEVLAGEKPDARADIYALGIIIYQLLMKRSPAIFADRPSEHSLDPRFDQIVMKAAASEREKRYKTAGELKRALELIPTMNVNPANAPVSSSAKKTAPNITDDEYPTPDPASIVIEFGETSLVVNGLDFSLNTSIEDWIQVLGRYSEIEVTKEHDAISTYFWYKLGLVIRTFYRVTDTVYIFNQSSDAAILSTQKEIIAPSTESLSQFAGTLKIGGIPQLGELTISKLRASD